jgi:hypothetical protein
VYASRITPSRKDKAMATFTVELYNETDGSSMVIPVEYNAGLLGDSKEYVQDQIVNGIFGQDFIDAVFYHISIIPISVEDSEEDQ